jgi:hypothetical protein
MAGIPILTHLGLDHFIGADAGEVRLNGKLLPGLLQSMTIRSAMRTDGAQFVSGAQRTQPMGFEPAAVRLVLELTSEPSSFVAIGDQVAAMLGKPAAGGADDTCYGKVKTLSLLHTAVDAFGAPVQYRLTNKHTLARAIREVWFTGFETAEGNEDTVMATLEFTQVESPSFDKLAVEAAKAAPAGSFPSLSDEDLPV